MEVYKFKTKLASFDKSGVWKYHFMVPTKYVQPLTSVDKRVVCTVNGSFTLHCALMPYGDGKYFITANNELRSKLKLELGDIVEIDLVKDTSEYGMPIPAVFKELLEQDLQGSKVFHSLTRGKQRDLLYLIGKPKSEDLKVHKGVVVLNYLKSVDGNLDYKELHQSIKDNPFKIK